MAGAIFLSAGVPDQKRGPTYAATADTVAITAAVSALIHVTLGRRMLVWGGHPAITPMIWVVAQDIGVDYGRWVRLYQSRHFRDEFPEDNDRFSNVIFTDDVAGDQEKSLKLMRKRMFSENVFSAAVFVGGMRGIVEEYELFRRYQPNAAVLPIVSTGGAVLEVASRMGPLSPDLQDERDYVALFHRHLGISVREDRYRDPDAQPAIIEERYWRPTAKRVDKMDAMSDFDQRSKLMALTATELKGLINKLIAEIGWEPFLSRISGERGVDSVALHPRMGGSKVVIQTKRSTNTVGVNTVRQLVARVQKEGASLGILATTSAYGKAASEFAKGRPLVLLDGRNLFHLLAEHRLIDARIVTPDRD